MATKNRFVGLGRDIFLYQDQALTRKFRQVLWGDFLTVKQDLGSVLSIAWAPDGPDPQDVFIRKAETTESRPLEIIFVDVGQGDGAVLITPESEDQERIMVIDAGEHDKMGMFLDDRFGTYKTGFDFHAAVITHPDQDHYGGFKEVFSHDKIGFDVVYHNGLVERPEGSGFERLGGLSEQKHPETGQRYLAALPKSRTAIRKDFDNNTKNGRKRYANVMKAALDNDKIKRIEMLSTDDGEPHDGRNYVPGFGPGADRGYAIEVLGPVVEKDAQGKVLGLRKLGGYGETKNGHSVLLKLTIGDFRVLFGGDLNARAETFLMAHYTGREEVPTEGTDAEAEMIEDARRIFKSDVMKVCHHGSSEVTDAFLSSVHAAAYVISSGDQEGYVHPRPDLLGRLGRLGRGAAPVLLSTELQRSSRDEADKKLVASLRSNVRKLARQTQPIDPKLTDAIDAQIEELSRDNVSVWGSIYVKTDGKRLITAFKKETGSVKDKWFYFEYAFDDDRVLQLVEE